MSRYDGGPAFPQISIEQQPNSTASSILHVGGMSLRDYLSTKAMEAYIIAVTGNINIEAISKWSYEFADAMLKARAK